jgi:hypothetical protein
LVLLLQQGLVFIAENGATFENFGIVHGALLAFAEPHVSHASCR